MKTLKGIVEALLLATNKPLSPRKMGEIAEVGQKEVKKVLQELIGEYQRENRGFQLREVAGGYRFYTRPEYSSFVEKLAVSSDSRKFSQAALETLAIIAYKQPITKAEIRAIRGVNVDTVLNSLLEKEVIREVGKKDSPGQPLLYGTTSKFLETFGLKNVDDLPPLERFAPDEETKKAIRERLVKKEIVMGNEQ